MAKQPEESSSRKKRKRTGARRRVLMFACGLCLLGMLAAGDYWGYPYGASVKGSSLNHGENGLWLRYTWYFGRHSDAERKLLARQLHSRQVRYAFFHVRHIGKDGKLAYRYAAQAHTLTAGLHQDCPDVKIIAWVYVSDTPPERAVHLEKVDMRRTLVTEALWLVRDCGFDGVQWDVEPCQDGANSFLALMRETKAALPPGKLLSTATSMWLPAGLRRYGWSDAYFARVAATCDLIAVMCYDSGVYFPRAYVGLVHQQAVHVTRAVKQGNAKCRVLLGVPTYGEGLPSHNPKAETLAMALRGVREGLADPAADPSVFAGVSLFADYTTTAQDWRAYNVSWLDRERSRP